MKKLGLSKNQSKPTSPSHKKQFELLYRERQHMPSQEPYESIIFMKSKYPTQKHFHQNINSQHRGSAINKGGKETVEELKKVIAQLQKHIQVKAQPGEKPSSNLKIKLQKCIKTNRNASSQRKILGSKEESSLWQKLSTHRHVGGQNQKVSKIKQVISPAKKRNTKMEELSNHKIMRKSQDKLMTIRSKQKGKQKKNRKYTKQKIQVAGINKQQDQYCLLDGKFVQIQAESSFKLDEKLASTHMSSQHIKNQEKLIKKNEDLAKLTKQERQIYMQQLRKHQLQIEERNDALFNMKQCLQQQEQQEEQYDYFQYKPDNEEHNLEIIQKYFDHKITMIQRWWRHILRKNKEQQYLLNRSHEIEHQNKIVPQDCEVSPIRRMEQFCIQTQKMNNLQNMQFCYPQINNPQQKDVQQSKGVQFRNNDILIVSRQKSTACHINKNTDENVSQDQQTQYRQKFPKIEERNISPEQQLQFYGQNHNNMPVTHCFDTSFKQLLDVFKQNQEVKRQIDYRIAIQMGILPNLPSTSQNQKPIDTSLAAIHRFLLSFFKYYIFYYRDDFLTRINMPFGFRVETRLESSQVLQYPFDTKQTENEQQIERDGLIEGMTRVIPPHILDQYYISMSKSKKEKEKKGNLSMKNQFLSKQLQVQKSHNKAVLECFNIALNQFRPYYAINGPPYPWTHSEKALTFYFITQDNIQQVFEKTQFKVLKWASTLCGVLVDKYIHEGYQNVQGKQIYSSKQILNDYRTTCHPILYSAREERIYKKQKQQLGEQNQYWYNCQENRTKICIKISAVIFGQLLMQCLAESIFQGQFRHQENQYNQ